MINMIIFGALVMICGGVLWCKHFFSENQKKKRRWAKVMEIRNQMLEAKSKGDNKKWNELNIKRENLLNDIFKKIA